MLLARHYQPVEGGPFSGHLANKTANLTLGFSNVKNKLKRTADKVKLLARHSDLSKGSLYSVLVINTDNQSLLLGRHREPSGSEKRAYSKSRGDRPMKLEMRIPARQTSVDLAGLL
jgi:hypothetical protein